MGDPILIEDESHENHDDISSNQSETSSDYEKRKAKRTRKARSPRSYSPKPKLTVFKPEERPKRNKATTRFQQYKAERSARDQRTIDQKMKQPI